MKNMLKVLMFSLILFGGMEAASATSILVLPTSNQNITGSITANCTGSVTYNNASFQYYLSGWQTIGTNSTAGTQWNLAIDETDAADGAYNMRCLANGTVISSNVSLVGWDDTGPASTLVFTNDPMQWGDSQTITLTVVDAAFTDDQMASAQLTLEDSVVVSMTRSGSSKTVFTYSYIPQGIGTNTIKGRGVDAHSQTGSWASSTYQTTGRDSSGGRIAIEDVILPGQPIVGEESILSKMIKSVILVVALAFVGFVVAAPIGLAPELGAMIGAIAAVILLLRASGG